MRVAYDNKANNKTLDLRHGDQRNPRIETTTKTVETSKPTLTDDSCPDAWTLRLSHTFWDSKCATRVARAAESKTTTIFTTVGSMQQFADE